MNSNNQIILKNKEVVNLALTISGLSKLKTHDENFYRKLCKYVLEGTTDILEMCDITYGAYLIANYDNEKKYTKEEFLDLMPDDIGGISNLIIRLIYPKSSE